LTEIGKPENKMRTKTIPVIILSMAMLSSCMQGRSDKRAGNAIQDPEPGTAEVVFSEYEHDFGPVKEGTKVSHVFHFVNKGPGNLVIQSALTTCGCTVSRYSRKPIAPGKEGRLEVVFNTSGKNGMQTKTVTVRSNASKPVVILKITAEVSSDK